ncbi:MAG: C45 family peptidase, partial [Thermodesulfobacteriota bacterium]|nr:C45 family peptidase [Thermodesulfobacteriota bacterium]
MSENGVIKKREEGLTIVTLKGTPFEMGLQHGTLLKDEITRIHTHLTDYLANLKRGVWGRTIYPLLQLLVWGYNLFTPAEYRAELKGLARGAGLRYASILLINVLDDLGHKMACSCFTVKGQKTKENILIYGRNLDYGIFTDLMPTLTTIFCYHPSSGFPFISVGWPAYAGVVTGMSSKKLVVGSLTSFSKEKARLGTPSGLLY